jgi:hypothetical protein
MEYRLSITPDTRISNTDLTRSFSPSSPPRYGRVECVSLLLSVCRRDADLRNVWGVTPLLYAAQFSHAACVRALLASGAVDADATDTSARSPLHHACKKRAVDCVKMLVRHGVKLNVSDQDTATPLMDAISSDAPGCVLALIQGNCNLDIVGKATVQRSYIWSTPFQAALKTGHFKCARMLYLAACPLGSTIANEDVMGMEEWVKDVFKVPRSLSIWARAVIHRALGRNASGKVKELPIPKQLQLFVAYYDLALLIE